MNRPLGSNADEWNLFLLEHLGPMNNGSSYVAVQIAEAIDEASASHDRLLAAAKVALGLSYYDDEPWFLELQAAIAAAEELKL